MSKRQVILVISDLHIPYQHRDAFKFLRAVKAKFKPTQIVSSGDELDNHSISFHKSDPDLHSAGDELKASIKELKKLYKIFPQVTIMESNHGSLWYRKAMDSGLPANALRSYNEILQAPRGWKWVFDLTVPTPLGPIYFHHSRGPALKVAQSFGMSHVNGHHHETFAIQYWSTPEKLMFGMTVGCLVDRKSLALAYSKNNLKRQILGVGVIIDGVPQLVPMLLNKQGRWVGRL